MKKTRKMRFLLTALAMVILLTSACGAKNEKTSGDGTYDLSSYPIKTDITLSYFVPLRAESAGMIDNYSETFCAQELEKRTGVKIEYIHPAVGQQNEMLSLLIASNELPDIVQNNWGSYSGGLSAAVKENVVIPLNDYKEYAPALFKLYEENPSWNKQAKNDDGYYAGFPDIAGSSILRMSAGPVIRADWLRELGLSAPETIAEWEEVLTAFKDKKGVAIPFSTTSIDHLYPMFGAHNGSFIENNEYKFGWTQPEMKVAVTHLNDWFNKGLLDKNLFAIDKKSIDAQVLTGQTGATITSGGDIGRYMNAAEDPNFELIGVRYPTYEKGKVNDCMNVSHAVSSLVSSVTTRCKYPELAVKMLDWFYTEEGHIFANFGVEGVTFNYDENNEPKYSDVIMKNPDGLSMMESLALHTKAGTSGPYETSVGYIMQYYNLPQQQKALEEWQIGFDESTAKRALPVSRTPEESAESSDIMSEVIKQGQMRLSRFITGQEPIDNFDAYVEEMEKIGLSKALKAYTSALARYNNR